VIVTKPTSTEADDDRSMIRMRIDCASLLKLTRLTTISLVRSLNGLNTIVKMEYVPARDKTQTALAQFEILEPPMIMFMMNM
jgi:hypothetical protein